MCRLLTEHDLEVRAGSTAGKEKMRMVYERALSAGGLHISEGSKLWAAARQGSCFVPYSYLLIFVVSI